MYKYPDLFTLIFLCNKISTNKQFLNLEMCSSYIAILYLFYELSILISPFEIYVR